jgi:MscS family membrane protein
MRSLCAFVLAFAGLVPAIGGQTLPGTPVPATAPAPERDALGRSTPRGTVLGFLNAARKGDDDLASRYLNAPAGEQTETLAHQMFLVLDARLPARLAQLSDALEGSRANPLAPDQEVIGTIEGASGPFDVIVERVKRPKADPIWLFSAKTLGEIPGAYEQIASSPGARLLPRFLFDHRIGGIRLYELLALFIGLPVFYLVTVLLNRALTPLMAFVGRRLLKRADGSIPNALPTPARVLLLSVAARWLLTKLPFSLMVRQFLSGLVAMAVAVAVAWLIILLNGEVERAVTRRIPRANFSAGVSLLRVGRRIFDLFVVLGVTLGMLRHFGIDVTPLLAGLGVGGIAVALAAQKTLENVIAGASLIFDQAVRIGDFLRIGTMEGTVEHIGLRSTRFRTLDRSIVSVPNSQIANMSVEMLSARDKFWFHPVVGLRYETTTAQMELVLTGVKQMLARQAAIDGPSIRVRFLRLGAFSLDVEIFAYAFARDWPHFLEIQEGLLLRITEIVTSAGTGIAFPSQTMYVEHAPTELTAKSEKSVT